MRDTISLFCCPFNQEISRMFKRIPDHLFSALIGGVVGAVVVLLMTGQKPAVPSLGETAYAQVGRLDLPGTPNGKFQTLEVENLVITNQASLLNKEGHAELVLRDGSVLAEKVILGNKLVGQQMQGHSIVANRIFATPDDLVRTPMEQWKFYAEIGASTEAGGEIVVRDASGFAMVGTPTSAGSLFRMGYNPEQQAQMLAIRNADRSVRPVSFELSEEQKRMFALPAR